jgi:phosphatidylinositol glycan class C protein
MPKKWKKILYQKQEFEDNYVDSSFLNLMQKNVNVKELQYWEVVVSTCRITQQTSTIVMFLNKSFLFQLFCITFCTCLVPKRYWISGILFSTVLVFMTPILKDLTRDISGDTIIWMTIGMFLINLLFHDYDGTAKTQNSISINAAMCASVLLASRMDTNQEVGTLMFSAVSLFALFPIYRKYARTVFPTSDGWMATTLFMISLFCMEGTYRGIYVFASLILQFACPYILVKVQKYKKYLPLTQ